VFRDIKRTARQVDVEDVATAVAVAGEAMEVGELPRALELLKWASSRATRSTSIREGLGIAYYLSGRFEEAQRELQAYRRMSGRADQNHLLADCARALDHEEKVVELVDEMSKGFEDKQVPIERLVEGLIVQAGMRADAGDHEGALDLLEQAPLPDTFGEPHARVWYAAGDMAEQMGDGDRAREFFESVQMVDEDFLDVEQRLAALQD
jgi:tetratricopeptide (TPR) repeat protein